MKGDKNFNQGKVSCDKNYVIPLTSLVVLCTLTTIVQGLRDLYSINVVLLSEGLVDTNIF